MSFNPVSNSSLDPFFKITSPDLQKNIATFLDETSLFRAILVSKSWQLAMETDTKRVGKSHFLSCEALGHSCELATLLFKNRVRLLSLPKIDFEGATIVECVNRLSESQIPSPIVQFKFNKEQPGVLFSIQRRIDKTWGVIVIFTYFNMEYPGCAPWHEMVISSSLTKKLIPSIASSTAWPGTQSRHYIELSSLLEDTNPYFILSKKGKHGE